MLKSWFIKLDLTLLPFMSWLRVLNQQTVKADVIAGVVAGILIVPQAVALAIIAGMPPEHGLYTAIIPVIVAALFGSSWQGLSGPNTALVIMIAAALAPYAVVGSSEYIVYAVTLSFMVGIFQLLFAFSGFGGIFNYFSQTVMVALVTGVGLLIIGHQVNNFVGVDAKHASADIGVYWQLFNPFALLVGVATIACSMAVRKFHSHWPHYIISLVFGSVFALVLEEVFGHNVTNIAKLEAMSFSLLPLSMPEFDFIAGAAGLIPEAFFIAIMGLTQSTVIARTIAGKTGKRVSFNQEVLGQGLANLVGSFFSCFPSCGSFNRSAANLESGACTPLAGIVSAVVLAILVFSAGSLLVYMPVAVMAAILFLVGMSLIKWQDIKLLIKMHGESRYVFTLTLLTTLIWGLQNGVLLGAVLSLVAYWRSASVPEIEVLFEQYAEPYLPKNHHDQVVVVKVSGSLLLKSASELETTFGDLANQQGRQQLLVVAADKMQNIDRGGLDVLDAEAQKRQQAGGGLQLWFSSPKVHVEFATDTLFSFIQSENIFYRSA